LTYTAQGTYAINWSYDDGNGNIVTQTQTVVIDDVTAPVADLDPLPNATGECSVTVTTVPTATDNCEGTINGTTTDPLTYTAQGTYFITWTYDDGNGNTSTQTQTVVVDDVTAPVADLDPLPDVVGDCGVTVSVTPTALDNCEGVIIGTTTDPLTYTSPGSYTIIWSYDDGNGNVSTQSQTVNVAGYAISGTFNYYNTASTPLNNITVQLKQGSSVIATTTTGITGNYTFTDICPGTYDVLGSTSTKIAGGINSTDAAAVNNYSVKTPGLLIEKVQFFAGDVNPNTTSPNNYLNAADPQGILKYYLQSGVPPFGRGPWIFQRTGETYNNSQPPVSGMLLPSITVSGSMSNVNFYGLCTGDFNRSFTPGLLKTANENLLLNYGQNKKVKESSEFELPIYSGSDMEVGAITLAMNFPSDKLEILGVYANNDENLPVMFNVSGDELRIAWTSTTPLNLKAGEKMLTLKVKNSALIGTDEIIRFSLAADPLNELADGNVNVISKAVLIMETVGAAPANVDEFTAESLTFTNYPNPFAGNTTFAYTLPSDGEATIEVFNLLGSKVKVFINEAQTAGDHTLTVDASTLKPGVYMATLRLKANGQMLDRTIKIVRNQ